MAYSFNGTDQYLTANPTPVQNEPFTLVGRFITSDTTTDRYPLNLTNTTNTDAFFVRHDGRSPSAAGAGKLTGSYAEATATVSRTANAYFSMGHVAISNSSRKVFFKQGGATVTNSNNTNINDSAQTLLIAIGVIARATPVNYWPGDIAEVALWSTDLTDLEVESYLIGFSPRRIRPQSLVFYAPMIRNLQDLRGALTITNNKSATVAAHPRVY
jgi:hypothetical protein